MNIECQGRKDLLCITQLVSIYSNHIMFAYNLCGGQIKMTERADFAIVATTAESDSTNHQSSINNQQ